MSKSVEELFKDAPEGATHWDASDCRINSFMKLEGDMWFFWPPASREPSWYEWGKVGSNDVSCMIPRPQPKPWSGPEDGLPPVGTTCEALNGLHDQWRIVLILDHEGSVPTAACRDEENRLWWSQEFRAIKTPEQLAAEKRESAIREFMDVVGIDCRVTASKAVDAGFKREVV